MFKQLNLNPKLKLVGDCVIRAIALFEDIDWDTAYLNICLTGYDLKDMPSSNSVWPVYLKQKGYKQQILPDCPNCITIREFSDSNKRGRFLLATGTHVVTVIDGDYYDTADSGDEIINYYFK